MNRYYRYRSYPASRVRGLSRGRHGVGQSGARSLPQVDAPLGRQEHFHGDLEQLQGVGGIHPRPSRSKRGMDAVVVGRNEKFVLRYARGVHVTHCLDLPEPFVDKRSPH